MDKAKSHEFILRDNILVIISIIAGTVGAISNGIHLGLSPLVIPPCNSLVNASTNSNHTTICWDNEYDQNLFRTCYMVGTCIGVLLSIVSYKLGPKKLTITSSTLLKISWILVALQLSVKTIHAARILAGLCMSATIISGPRFIKEIQPQSIKNGFRFIYLGVLFGVLLAYILSPFISVLTIAILGAVLALIQQLLSFFITESPYFLIWINKNLEAKAALKKLRNTNSVEDELIVLTSTVIRHKRESRNQSLFSTKVNRLSSISVALTMIGQQFCGIPILLMFQGDILKTCDIKIPYNIIVSITFVVVVMFVGNLGKTNVFRNNSKCNLISIILCMLSMLILATYIFIKSIKTDFNNNMSWIPVLSIFLYAVALGLDKGYFPINVIQNYYPYSLHYSGIVFATGIQIVVAWILVEIVQRITFGLKIYIILYVLAVLNCLSTVVTRCCIPPSRKKEATCSRYYPRNNGEIADHENMELKGEVLELVDRTNLSAVDKNTADIMTVTPNESIFKGTASQLIPVLAGTLTAISDGMQYGWTSPIIPILQGPDSPVKVTKGQIEWLETSLMLGSFSGLWMTIYLVDKIGRKRSILLASLVTVIIWIVTAVAPRVEYIFAARAFAGSAGNMAFVATPMYIAEIAEQKIRGFLSSLIYLMMLCGILLIYSVAPFVPFYAHCVLGGSLALTQLIIFPFMPESPYYLLYNNKPEAALKSLKRLRADGHNVEKELEYIKATVDRQKAERGKIHDLVIVPSNRRAMVIMALLNAAQHFSSISVLLMNIHDILAAAGSIYIQPQTAAILFSLIMVMAASVASLTIDKYGRKTLLISSSLATGICLLVLAIYFSLKNGGYNTATYSWIPIACVMLYALTFKLGLGMVPIVLTAELFPAKMKAFGMTLADGFYVISSLLSLQVYQRLTESYGLQYPFYVFSASCFIAAVFTFLFIPETKGKTLEEIQMILKGNPTDTKNQSP